MCSKSVFVCLFLEHSEERGIFLGKVRQLVGTLMKPASFNLEKVRPLCLDITYSQKIDS